MRPILLDLFCGAGGASAGYYEAGFDVYGIDIAPQHNYPFRFVQADAIESLRTLVNGGAIRFGDREIWYRDIEAVHASPPCQLFTAYRRKGHGVGDGYPNLIPATRELLIDLNRPAWVIENVEGAPLENAVRLCGSSFELDVRRHRYFESNITLVAPPCDHSWQTPRFAPASNRTNLRRTVEVGVWRIPLDVQAKAMGISWMTLHELSEAIPPAYTEWIGCQLMDFALVHTSSSLGPAS